MASVPVNMRGEWDSSSTYEVFDGVTYSGKTWVAVQASSNKIPSSGSTYWYNAGTMWNDAGKVAITPKGNYNASTQYEPLDLVKNLDKVWLSKKNSTGVTPAEGTYWMLMIDAIADFTGATSNVDGSHGLVPQPQAGDENKILYGNGDWKSITASDQVYDNTDSGLDATNTQDAVDEIAARLLITYDPVTEMITIPTNVGSYNPNTEMITLN